MSFWLCRGSNPLYPSLAGLKEMLNVCESYAKEYNILFNTSQLV